MPIPPEFQTPPIALTLPEVLMLPLESNLVLHAMLTLPVVLVVPLELVMSEEMVSSAVTPLVRAKTVGTAQFLFQRPTPTTPGTGEGNNVTGMWVRDNNIASSGIHAKCYACGAVRALWREREREAPA